jgi:DNA polymerase III sliding clamp (beta) subunit (PCNA family)
MSQAKIRFSIGDVTLTSKLIDGTFPDYRARHSGRQRQRAQG